MYAGFLDLRVPPFWTVDDALPAEVAESYVQKFRSGEAEVAPIVGRDGRPVIEVETRNNTRVMWDDAAEANGLLERVRARVPERLMGLVLRGANPRLRIYRYGVGERHGAHFQARLDGCVLGGQAQDEAQPDVDLHHRNVRELPRRLPVKPTVR